MHTGEDLTPLNVKSNYQYNHKPTPTASFYICSQNSEIRHRHRQQF